MRRAQIAVVVTVAAASACACGTRKSTGGAATGDSGAGAVAPLQGLDGGPPDEDALRSGKRSGMAGDVPEVATEPLVTALVEGRMPWARFVDPKLGVVELRRGAGDDRSADGSGRRCGAEVEPVLATHAEAITTDLARAELDYQLTCSNLALFFADPDGAAPHAICSFDSSVEYAIGHDLLFVPDSQRGLRLVGITAMPGGDRHDADLDAFSAEIGKTGSLCP